MGCGTSAHLSFSSRLPNFAVERTAALRSLAVAAHRPFGGH